MTYTEIFEHLHENPELSFEEFEIEYKYLKAIIEGGLEVRPENVLIYATSNRRHLIRETWADRPDSIADDMHQTDTVQEKLSLAERFGLAIGFFRPDQETYFAIVRELARRKGIDIDHEELIAGARRFSMMGSRGACSPCRCRAEPCRGLGRRPKRAFIDDLKVNVKDIFADI